MEEIFCNSAFAHILESIFLHLEPQDLKNCRKVNTNFKNVLDQPFLWLKIYQAKGIFEQSQNFNLWETLVKLTNRTTLGKNVAKCLMNLNDYLKSFKIRTEIIAFFTPFHVVAHQGSDLELMEFMVDNLTEFGYESLDQCLDGYGFHPLHKIVKNNGNEEMIKFLIRNIKNVDVKTKPGCWTPLHWAVIRENLEAVKLLLANGADPESKDFISYTPIMYARILRNEEILDYLQNKDNH